MDSLGAGGRTKALQPGAGPSASRELGAAERTESAPVAEHSPHHRRRVVNGSSAARAAPALPRVLPGGVVPPFGVADSLHRFRPLAARLLARGSVAEAGYLLEGTTGWRSDDFGITHRQTAPCGTEFSWCRAGVRASQRTAGAIETAESPAGSHPVHDAGGRLHG